MQLGVPEGPPLEVVSGPPLEVMEEAMIEEAAREERELGPDVGRLEQAWWDQSLATNFGKDL